MQKAANTAAQNALVAGAKAAQQYGFDYDLQPKYLKVTIERASRKGLYDLKPAFKHSDKVKYTKAGDWYLIVPIRRTVRSMDPSSVYRQARQIQMDYNTSTGLTTGTSFVDMLYGVGAQSSAVPELNRTTGGGNLTRVKKGNSSQYFAFRTVSAKSPVNAWIVGRSQVNDEDMSKTMINNIKRIISRGLSRK